MKILKEGDKGVALAPGRGKVPVVYRYQDLTLDSGAVVRDVMVGLCEHTGVVLTIPAQSTPKIKLARRAAREETFSVRIPHELDDLIWLVSAELGTNPARFGAALIRFYLKEAAASVAFARRLKRLASDDLVTRASKAKLTLRSDPSLLDQLDRLGSEHDVSRSDLVRGAVIAAKEDVLEKKSKRRLEQLRAIAEAV
ncbi:MAG: hypothetical protein ACREMA_04875 [Longimicrobiales bacterium]